MQFPPAGDTEFPVDARQVELHRAHSEEEGFRDLAVAVSGAGQFADAQFLTGQVGQVAAFQGGPQPVAPQAVAAVPGDRARRFQPCAGPGGIAAFGL